MIDHVEFITKLVEAECLVRSLRRLSAGKKVRVLDLLQYLVDTASIKYFNAADYKRAEILLVRFWKLVNKFLLLKEVQNEY